MIVSLCNFGCVSFAYFPHQSRNFGCVSFASFPPESQRTRKGNQCLKEAGLGSIITSKSSRLTSKTIWSMLLGLGKIIGREKRVGELAKMKKNNDCVPPP